MTDWSKSHCGVMLCDVWRTIRLMPEVEPILAQLCPVKFKWWREKLIDVKVHMLMPGQFPCIPNWHRDFLPRGADGQIDPDGAPSEEQMWMWMSGPPLPWYIVQKTGRIVAKPANKWHSFTQADVHRGTASEEHTWRCFIRVIPASFIHGTTTNVGTLRRHSQVYLDSEKFSW